MSFSVRKDSRIVMASPGGSSFWSSDASGNISNTNTSQDVQIQGQIIAKNGFGIVDQVLALTNTGEMVWKDVSGSGGLANRVEVFQNTTNKSYFLTMVEGSGNQVVYIDSSGLSFNPSTNNLDISQGTLRITTNTSTGSCIVLNNLNPNRDDFYNTLIQFQENGSVKAYIWYQSDQSGQTQPSMLRLGNGNGATSWSIATSEINKLSYGHPSGQKDALVGIKYGTSNNGGPHVDPSVNKILHLSNERNVGLTPLVYTTTGRLGLGIEFPNHILDISYADISAMRVGNTLFVDTSNNRVRLNKIIPESSASLYIAQLNANGVETGNIQFAPNPNYDPSIRFYRDISTSYTSGIGRLSWNCLDASNNPREVCRLQAVPRGPPSTSTNLFRRGDLEVGICNVSIPEGNLGVGVRDVSSTTVRLALGPLTTSSIDVLMSINSDNSTGNTGINFDTSNNTRWRIRSNNFSSNFSIQDQSSNPLVLLTQNGNVAIGRNITDPITTSAILELNTTTKGFLPPKMTTAQKNAISSPAEGLMIYDTDLKRPCFYNGTSWITL